RCVDDRDSSLRTGLHRRVDQPRSRGRRLSLRGRVQKSVSAPPPVIQRDPAISTPTDATTPNRWLRKSNVGPTCNRMIVVAASRLESRKREALPLVSVVLCAERY